MNHIRNVIFLTIISAACWSSLGSSERVTLIPPQNLLHMLSFDVSKNRVGVLSGVPIPTLWPVLPLFAYSSTRIPQISALLEANLSGQLPPISDNLSDNVAFAGSGSGGDGEFLTQLVRPSSSSSVGAQVPQLMSSHNNALQIPTDGYPNFIRQQPVNHLLQQMPTQNSQSATQQQIPVGPISPQPISQTFGNIGSPLGNPVTQEILQSASYNDQPPPTMANAFGSFLLPDTSQPQNVSQQFSSPSQVYGYGSQGTLLSSLKQTPNGPENSSSLQQDEGLVGPVPGSAYANALDDQYPGCHK